MSRLGCYLGKLAPPLLVAVLVPLTITERGFLRRAGWSPVKRTAVEWPSILLLSHVGWIEALAFVAAGAMTIALAAAIFVEAPTRIARTASAPLALGGACLCAVASRPDAAGASSWHGRLHDAAYETLLLSALLTALLMALGLRQCARWRRSAQSSALAFVAVGSAAALTSVDGIAQLARYFLLVALLGWLEFIAFDVPRNAGS